jgi:hypothetical protein
MPDAPDLQAARAAARTVAWFAAALLATAFGWFAWVDAPLAELALILFAVATACAAVAIIAALLSIEATLQAAPMDTASGALGARSVRMRRTALLFLAIALVLMLSSATMTLSLQGQARDQQDDTAVSA